MENILVIKDRDTILQISYEDMIKYHGRFHIGGVALAFKALQLGFARLLPPGQVPSRSKIAFASGMGPTATGVLDGVEMVTRAGSKGRMTSDTVLGKNVTAPETPNAGKFYFELTYDGVKLGLALKEGLVPEEFISLSRQAMARTLDNDGARRLQEVKEELAATLMSNKAEDLFNCIELG
ncbi:MAG TPA: hypothetical protein VN426_08500 [Syntrophomonadaceae bacterium]|nr:hypothetical protein [Syntrophomonadaceae bacterium]